MRTAHLLAALAVRLAPRGRKTWAAALEAELEHVAPVQRISFAAGGVVLGLRLRLADPAFVLGASRYGLAAAALIWAALHWRLALHLNGIDRSPAAVIPFVAAAIFALGGAITAIGGLRFTCRLGLPALVVAAACTTGAGLLLPESPNRSLYQALALEDLLSLAVAVTIAAAARRYASGQVDSA